MGDSRIETCVMASHSKRPLETEGETQGDDEPIAKHARTLSDSEIHPPTDSPQFENIRTQLVCHTESWQGTKTVLEDRYVNGAVLPGIGVFYGLFDGHGGTRCAEYLAKNLHKNILAAVTTLRAGAVKSGKPLSDHDAIMQGIRVGFQRTDTEFLKLAHIKDLDEGSTALVVILTERSADAAGGDDEKKIRSNSGTKDDGGGAPLADGASDSVENSNQNIPDSGVVMYVVNLGDSRAVLCRNGKPVRMSEDHKPDRWDEKMRIERSGGFVVNVNGTWRVTNTSQADLGANKRRAHLATSRSIGDRDLKEPPILSSGGRIKIYFCLC
eukprot:c20260_g1_i1.p1 GENE.c20260_g1_i1~~c20260_g1_i1.p1  ORF type:complete len:326 (-),score=61.98 c20260_g1_i1:999-1976(-)